MARTANRYLQPCMKSNEVFYKTAVYLRLSIESKRKDSESIENQRLLIQEYLIKHPELNENVHEYVDDGKSGTNFERTEFQCLREDIKAGKINCIVVKDLSRFARNHMEAGEYLENVFPYLGIRFIALTEEYDSADPDCTKDQLSMNLKNLINELYARDGSKKVHTSYRIKQEAKVFYRSAAIPYGYRMEQGNYVPDELTEPYIRMIFEEYGNGVSKYEIVQRFAELNLSPPKKYRETGLVKFDDTDEITYWDISVIDRILKNEVYIGHIIRHKTEQRLFEDMPNQIIPEEEQVRIENNHMPIIQVDLFEQVQKRRAEVREQYLASGKPTQIETIGSHSEDIFAGRIYCGCCGSHMGRYSNYFKEDKIKKRYMVYYCSKYRRNHGCQSTAKIKEADLCNLMEEVITKQIKAIGRCDNVVEDGVAQVFKTSIKSRKGVLERIQTQILLVKREKFEKYAEYADGGIDKEEFTAWKQRLNSQQEKLETKKQDALKAIRQLEALQKKTIRQWQKYIKNGRLELQKEDIQFFISKIVIYNDDRIEINLNYREIWDFLLEQKRGENLA